MKPQHQRRQIPSLVNICLGILKEMQIENPEDMLQRIRQRDGGNALYRDTKTVKLRDACAFWLRDLNHVPCCGGKISFPDIANVLGYRSHASAVDAVRRYTVYVDKVMKEDPIKDLFMEPQHPMKQTPSLVNICLGILKEMQIENPEDMLRRIRQYDGRRDLYKDTKIMKLRDACAFWLRDLNHVPCCGGKIPFQDIADVLGYGDDTGVMVAVRRYTTYVNKAMQEDPQAQERATYVDGLIESRKT